VGILSVVTLLNPPGQYADDRNFRARQRLWKYQEPFFDIVAWVIQLAGISPGMRVLDAGCGNGAYLRGLRERQAWAAGCDLSMGMLRAASHSAVLNADVTALPVRDGAFDAVLAVHMLYHVPSRESAIAELRRVLIPGGTCIAVTNGARHMRSLRELVERAVGKQTPGWQMRNPSTHAFAAENAAAQLGIAFQNVTCVRPPGTAPVVVRDATGPPTMWLASATTTRTRSPSPGRASSKTSVTRYRTSSTAQGPSSPPATWPHSYAGSPATATPAPTQRQATPPPNAVGHDDGIPSVG
jgi:SAM-dependent methyltransferase